MCRHVIKGKSYRIRVVRRHNTIVIVAIRMCRRVIEGKSYRIRVVGRHNSIVIVAIQMCRLAGKEKTIVGGVVAGVAGGEAGVGLRCANRDLRGGGGGWGEPCATSAGDGRRPYRARGPVVRRHNTVVIVRNRVVRLAGKEKTIVGGGAGGVGLRCANPTYAGRVGLCGG